MSVIKQLMDPIDFHSQKKQTNKQTKKNYGSQWGINSLITDILKNIFCVKQKKEIHTLKKTNKKTNKHEGD